VRAFGVYDPGNEIAWPAIFIVGPDGKIAWRKFLDEYKTRPPLQELLDAIDKK
jgi:alkyl hydroperoxide reductase subunit AhpC